VKKVEIRARHLLLLKVESLKGGGEREEPEGKKKCGRERKWKKV